MLQNFTELQKAFEERDFSDRRLINWWLFALLSLVTFSIFYWIIVYMRILRRDTHFDRMSAFFTATLKNTKEVAQKKKVDVKNELEKIERNLLTANTGLLRPKYGVLWVLLSILTGGLLLFYVYYFLLVDWYRIQSLEQNMLEDFSAIWLKLDMSETPITVHHTVPDRNYWLYLFLSVITLGIFAFYFDYVTHTDPDQIFPENLIWEQKVLDTFKEADIEKAA